MSDHPAPPVTGYHPLKPDQVDLMNAIKTHENMIADMLRVVAGGTGSEEVYRWVELARTHLETGYMYACKAVARPTGGLGKRFPEGPPS